MRRFAGGAARFAILTLALLASITLLAFAEAAALKALGVPASRSLPAGWNVSAFSFSADGRWGASLVRFQDDRLREGFRWDILFHDLRRPECAIRLDVADRAPYVVAISPLGEEVAFIGGSDSVYVWGRATLGATPRRLARLPGASLWQLAWSADGRIIAALGTQCVYVWEAASGELVDRFEHSRGDFVLLSICPDSGAVQLKRPIETSPLAKGLFDLTPSSILVLSPGEVYAAAACGGDQPGIVLRELRSGLRTGRLTGHTACILGMAFGPDHTLYSWDGEGSIIGWDVITGRQVWRFSAAEWDGAELSPRRNSGETLGMSPRRKRQGRLPFLTARRWPWRVDGSTEQWRPAPRDPRNCSPAEAC